MFVENLCVTQITHHTHRRMNRGDEIEYSSDDSLNDMLRASSELGASRAAVDDDQEEDFEAGREVQQMARSHMPNQVIIDQLMLDLDEKERESELLWSQRGRLRKKVLEMWDKYKNPEIRPEYIENAAIHDEILGEWKEIRKDELKILNLIRERQGIGGVEHYESSSRFTLFGKPKAYIDTADGNLYDAYVSFSDLAKKKFSSLPKTTRGRGLRRTTTQRGRTTKTMKSTPRRVSSSLATTRKQQQHPVVQQRLRDPRTGRFIASSSFSSSLTAHRDVKKKRR